MLNFSFYAKTVSWVNRFFIITRVTTNKEPHLRFSEGKRAIQDTEIRKCNIVYFILCLAQYCGFHIFTFHLFSHGVIY